MRFVEIIRGKLRPKGIGGSCSRVLPFFFFLFLNQRKWKRVNAVCFGCYPQWRSSSQVLLTQSHSKTLINQYAKKAVWQKRSMK